MQYVIESIIVFNPVIVKVERVSAQHFYHVDPCTETAAQEIQEIFGKVYKKVDQLNKCDFRGDCILFSNEFVYINFEPKGSQRLIWFTFKSKGRVKRYCVTSLAQADFERSLSATQRPHRAIPKGLSSHVHAGW